MLTAIGDMHIDKLEHIIPDSYKKILSTFDKVVANETALGAAAFVQLGDVFNNAYPDQIYTQAWLKSLCQLKRPIYMIPGNHDFDDPKHYALRTTKFLCDIGFIKGRVFLKPAVEEIDGDRYFFCPHPYIVDSPPKNVRMSFGHFGYEGARGDNGYLIKSGNAPKGRWVLGDYHTMQRGKNWAYPGSLTQCGFHEDPKKYVIRLTDKTELTRIQPKLKLGRATINSEEDFENLDPSVYWSVNISSKFKLPPDWAIRYPHIVRHHAEKDTSKRQRVLMQQVASEDPFDGFRDYLLENGMSEKEADRTYKLLGISHVQTRVSVAH